MKKQTKADRAFIEKIKSLAITTGCKKPIKLVGVVRVELRRRASRDEGNDQSFAA